MTDQERNEIIEKQNKELEKYVEYCKEQYPILEEKERTFDRAGIKTWKQSWEYWHNIRITMTIFYDSIHDRGHSMAPYYRDVMKLAIECLTESKNISEEIHERWHDYFATCNMDFVGEANCKIGTPYFPKFEELAVGEEKKIWEEIVELGNQYWDLMPAKKKKRYERPSEKME
jgi:hypothetical protein